MRRKTSAEKAERLRRRDNDAHTGTARRSAVRLSYPFLVTIYRPTWDQFPPLTTGLIPQLERPYSSQSFLKLRYPSLLMPRRGETQRAASHHTTWSSQGLNHLLDGGCFSKAKIGTSACEVRLSSLVPFCFTALVVGGHVHLRWTQAKVKNTKHRT